MPDSNRGDEPATLGLFGVISALVLCCFIVGILSFSNGQEAARRDKTPAAYAEAAKSKAQQDCTGLEGNAAFECIYEKLETSQQQAHDEQDLTAQQKSANGTMITAALAFLGLIASAVGIILVYTTFNEARKANKIAESMLTHERESRKAELQPYVFVERIDLNRSQSNPHLASITVILKNYGNTPAIYINPMIGWQIMDYPLTEKPLHFGMAANTISEIAPQQELLLPYPIAESNIGANVLSGPTGGKALIVHVSARYENRLDMKGASWSGFYIFDGPTKGFRRLAMFHDDHLGGFAAT
jgi:hypothetical protein